MSERYPARVFEVYLSEVSYRLREERNVSSDQRLVLNTICKRPELRPLLGNITFCIDNDVDIYFSLDDSRTIRIGHQLLNQPVVAAFHLRHAIELSILLSKLSLDSQLERFSITAIAALHTAMLYLDDMISQEKECVLQGLPDWMQNVFARISEFGSEEARAEVAIEVIGAHLRNLYPFQHKLYPGLDIGELIGPVTVAGMKRLKGLLSIAMPTERILTRGGDTRLEVDADTGLNQYGCSPRPRPWAITFSSCTSSSISDHAFWRAEKLRQALIQDAVDGQLPDRYKSELERVRRKLTDLLQLDCIHGAQLILTPSGTDAELYALHLAMGSSSQPICNILISRTEVGSGTALAAGGRHFDSHTPMGDHSVAGDPVEGFPVDSVEVVVLDLRGEGGGLLFTEELDGRIRERVEASLAKGYRVLLHLLDCSKTGIGGPSLGVAQDLKSTYPDEVEVLVDAAQFRLGRSALHRYVNSGFMVLITGSKFFTGPPFSGALIVPPEISSKVPAMPVLPCGMRAYATRAELPATWGDFGRNLSGRQNLGLLLRWQAALWEINAFYSVSEQERLRTIEVFGTQIIRMIDANPDLKLVMAPPHERGYGQSERTWDQLPTIFTFLVYRADPESGQRRPLSYDEARYAYYCVNADIARFLPACASDRDHELAAKRCHIGQPVRIHRDNGVWVGALRIAAGARLVSGVQFDDSLGDRPESRLDREIQTAGVIFGKLSVIVKYWNELKKYNISSGANSAAGFYQF